MVKEPSVEPTAEFVQAALQALGVQPVKRSLRKRLRVGYDDVLRPMEMLGLLFGVARDCGMDKAFFCKAVVNVQTVRPYLGTRFHAVLGENLDCLLTWKRRRRFMRGMNRTMGKSREFLAPYIPTPNDEAFVAQMKRTRKKARQSISRREPVCRNSGAAEAIARFSLFFLRTPLEFPT